MWSGYQLLKDSARDFANIVWPAICNFPLVGGGQLVPVEAQTGSELAQALDVLAGIDAWQIHDGRGMRGLASRVQWGKAHNSFTVRVRSCTGVQTEYHKRLLAMENPQEGYLWPHLTVQAYLDQPGGTLLSVAVIRTDKLFAKAKLLVDNRERLRLEERRDLFGFKSNNDGTEFLYMKWLYLLHERVLDPDNVLHAHK